MNLPECAVYDIHTATFDPEMPAPMVDFSKLIHAQAALYETAMQEKGDSLDPEVRIIEQTQLVLKLMQQKIRTLPIQLALLAAEHPYADPDCSELPGWAKRVVERVHTPPEISMEFTYADIEKCGPSSYKPFEKKEKFAIKLA